MALYLYCRLRIKSPIMSTILNILSIPIAKLECYPVVIIQSILGKVLLSGTKSSGGGSFKKTRKGGRLTIHMGRCLV